MDTPAPQAAPQAAARTAIARQVRSSRSYRLVLGIAGVAVLAALANVGFHQWRATQGAARGQAMIQATLQQDGIQTVISHLQAAFGPAIVTPQRPVRLDDLDPVDETPAITALQAALALYPPGFVHRLVDRVALAGDIVFFTDTEVGGFFVPRAVAINAQGDWTAEHSAFVTRTFHHEFSSLVRQAAPLDDAAWRALNPVGFTYLSYEQYRAMLKSGKPDDGTPALFEQGFARAYGQTDIDNDWNTYAERIFGDGPAFAALIKLYPRMQAKARLLMDTYQGMDPRFAAYFARTGLRAAVAGR